MLGKKRIFLKLALAVGCLMGAMSMTAWAATTTMSEVTVRVGAEATAEETVNERINYSVWDSLEAQVGTYATTESTKYSIRLAEWVVPDVRHVSIGGTPEMRIYLHMDADDYRFSSALAHRGVTVKGGTLVSADLQQDELVLVVRLNEIKGQFAAPDTAVWTTEGYGSGNATWTFRGEQGNLSSGAYDVVLRRGETEIKKLEAFRGESYDFFPYMKKEGTYSFQVRTVPSTEAERNAGKRSEWTESGGMVLTADQVSNGTGQGEWILDGENWYFQFPDQSRNTSPWFMVNTKWFLFDAEGRMLAGWQVKDGQTYYMDYKDGMLEGWQKIDGVWHYFHPGAGGMAVNTTIDGYVIDGNGVWNQ